MNCATKYATCTLPHRKRLGVVITKLWYRNVGRSLMSHDMAKVQRPSSRENLQGAHHYETSVCAGSAGAQNDSLFFYL
jgi:hypothetical protein